MRIFDRRAFMATLVPTALAMTAGVPITAQAYQGGERWLSFHNLHTGENSRATYRRDGALQDDGLRLINHALRDWRTGDVETIDPALLDLLYDLRESMGSREAFQVISGYRSPKSNAMLANKSSSVGKKSLHMRGMAIDIRLPGVQLRGLHKAAKTLQRGGVGYYAKSDFIHVDTGRVRYW